MTSTVASRKRLHQIEEHRAELATLFEDPVGTIQCLNRIGITPKSEITAYDVLNHCNAESGSPIMFTAAMHGRTDIVGIYLKHGAKVNWRNDRQQSALELAIEQNHITTCEVLCNAGAFFDAKTVTQIRRKATKKIDKGIDFLLVSCAQKRSMAIEKADLLEMGLKGTPLWQAIAAGELNQIHNILRLPDARKLLSKVTSGAAGETMLHMAARLGHVDIAETLLHRGAEMEALDAQGLTPLMVALLYNQVPMCQMLLKRGANTFHVDMAAIRKLASYRILPKLDDLLDSYPSSTPTVYKENIKTLEQTMSETELRNHRELFEFFAGPGRTTICLQDLHKKLNGDFSRKRLKAMIGYFQPATAQKDEPCHNDGVLDAACERCTLATKAARARVIEITFEQFLSIQFGGGGYMVEEPQAVRKTGIKDEEFEVEDPREQARQNWKWLSQVFLTHAKPGGHVDLGGRRPLKRTTAAPPVKLSSIEKELMRIQVRLDLESKKLIRDKTEMLLSEVDPSSQLAVTFEGHDEEKAKQRRPALPVKSPCFRFQRMRQADGEGAESNMFLMHDQDRKHDGPLQPGRSDDGRYLGGGNPLHFQRLINTIRRNEEEARFV